MNYKETKIEIPTGCEVEKTEVVDGSLVVTFKPKMPQLPKSWEEYCATYPVNDGEYSIDESGCVYERSYFDFRNTRNDKLTLKDRATAVAVLALCQLIQLRDCYNGDWVPDYKTADTKFTIEYDNNRIVKNTTKGWPCILIFKSEELRNLFLENFRDLIEKLKPLYGIAL